MGGWLKQLLPHSGLKVAANDYYAACFARRFGLSVTDTTSAQTKLSAMTQAEYFIWLDTMAYHLQQTMSGQSAATSDASRPSRTPNSTLTQSLFGTESQTGTSLAR